MQSVNSARWLAGGAVLLAVAVFAARAQVAADESPEVSDNDSGDQIAVYRRGGPPWAQGGRSGGPPWMQPRGDSGGPPWMKSGRGGSGPPWAQPGGSGGPPWMQGRGASGGPPWAQSGRGGGPPWMQGRGGGSPWGKMQSRGNSGPPPWVMARLKSRRSMGGVGGHAGGPPWMQNRDSGGPPWAQSGRGGGPPWMQSRSGFGGPPWAHGGSSGGPPWAKSGGFDGHGRFGAAHFSGLDSDNDGKITKEEVLAMHAKADADGDGAVTKEELQRHIKGASRGGHSRRDAGPSRRGDGRPSAATIFGRFDKNEDGKLAKDEVPEELWKRLSQADADGDGAVTVSELSKTLATRGAPPATVKDDDQ